MAVFIGDSKNTVAARTALKINFAVQEIVNPAILSQYPNAGYSVKHVVGIDTSHLFVARTGIRGGKRPRLGRPCSQLCGQIVCAVWASYADYDRGIRQP